jgi:hypothetical protein
MIDVEPLIASELERMRPLPDGGSADWSDVLRRAGSRTGFGRSVLVRRRWPMIAIATVAVLGAILAATPAWALVRDVLPFWKQPPAPSSTQKSFTSLDIGAPAGMAPGVSGPARSVIETQIAGKDVHLWVAPTTGGGFCFELEDSVAGCDRSRQLPIAYGGGQTRGSWVLTGDVLSADVDHVVLRYTDGTSATIPVVHVSDPINASFFVYPTAGPGGFTIQAVTAEGTVISSTSVPAARPPQPHAVAGK